MVPDHLEDERSIHHGSGPSGGASAGWCCLALSQFVPFRVLSVSSFLGITIGLILKPEGLSSNGFFFV